MAKAEKPGRCEGGGQPGLNGSGPGTSDRCPVCVARPKVDARGVLKSHEKKAPRSM